MRNTVARSPLEFLVTVMISVVSVGLGCGPSADRSASPTLAPKGTPLAAKAEPVEPFEAHQKQESRHALILGTSDGATKVPLAEAENEVTVDVMWFKKTKPATGGSSPTVLRVAPQDDGAVRVGVFEQFQGGAGEMSRASVWIAAFLASTTLGQDLTNYRFSADVKGFIDGPSAGALISAGYLAALTGAEIDPLATMTGTVNPDGTVGPVGGIPQKFEASIKKGKKRLGYPIGLRFTEDVNTGKLVDLRQLASQAGATAVEIKDIHGAYEFLTGRVLPRPTPATAEEMVPGQPTIDAIRLKYEGWLAEFASAHAKAIEPAKPAPSPAPTDADEGVDVAPPVAPTLPPLVLALSKRAKDRANQATKEAAGGDYIAAYATIREAATLASTGAEIRGLWDDLFAQDLSSAQRRTNSRMREVEAAVESMKKVGAAHPTTIGGHLQMISSFQKGTAAVGFAVWGQANLGGVKQALAKLAQRPAADIASPANQAAILRIALPAIINLERAKVAAQSARESIEIEAIESSNYSCSEPAARKLAVSYSSAAVANLRYFESILLPEIARSTGSSKERARQYLGQLDPDYVAATVAMQMSLGEVEFIAKLKEKWGEESLAWSLSSLGGSIMTYFKSSLLISRWYSLGIERNQLTGAITKVTHEKAFVNMLENAERSAREHAHAAKVAIGEVPLQARIEFERARVLRKGDLDSRLRSLESFWASSSYSQTAVVMALHVINPAKHGAHGR